MRRLSSSSFALWVVAATACSLSSVQAFTAGNGILLSSRHTNTGISSAPSALSVASPLELDASTAPSSDADQSLATAFAGTGTAVEAAAAADLLPMTMDEISKLRFRELHRELNIRHLATTGTTSQLRQRLFQAGLPDPVDVDCIIADGIVEDNCEPVSPEKTLYTFQDDSNPIQGFIDEIEGKAAQGHWKAATRKLKSLTKLSASDDTIVIPESVYIQVLDSCMGDRMHGARASEPARKILEQMVERGYEIPEAAGNFCIKNCIGYTGKDSNHQGFGGLDTALAMVAALEQAETPIQADSYDKLCLALAKEGSVEEALTILRRVVVDLSDTPPLSTFAQVAQAAVAHPANHDDEKVLSVLAYAKAAGYQLDTIASIEDGRSLLACGVIAAERLDNVALGLRLLTAAASAEGVAPDRGDTMVALSSSAAQRACLLIHKRAITKSVEDGQWKTAVRVLELMIERSLKPSSYVWRNVITCCAKAEKSKKATALLLDWVKLSERGYADKPPISVFNTCVNACEICNEQELTVVVLDKMQETHSVEGNLITFNIALKRLAKQHDFRACEGIILGMLQSDVEPSVVSYTTAIAACASKDNKQAVIANEWLKRMRSRKVMPNVLTYNTALSCCLDGTLESTFLGSKIASEMMADVERQLQESDSEVEEIDIFTNVVANADTKALGRRLMEQLKQNWKAGTIDKRVATDTVRVPLLQLVDFSKTEVAQRVMLAQGNAPVADDDDISATRRDEVELEYETAKRSAEV